MAEITKERQGLLVRKAFEILSRHADGLPARDVIARVEKELELTPFEQSFYSSNPSVRRFEKIIRFSTISSVKAGWLLKEKGRWILTESGRRAYEQFQTPEAFMREATRLYREWRRDQPEPDEVEELESETPGAATTLEEAKRVRGPKSERIWRASTRTTFNTSSPVSCAAWDTTFRG